MVDDTLIQRCSVEERSDERMTVYFESGLRLTTTALLGAGGFGKVFVAKSPSGDSYAMKISSKPLSETDWRRLQEEVFLMSSFMTYPNVVKFFAAGRTDDKAFVVMERCSNKSLHDIIAQRELSLAEVLWVGWSLIETLTFIHSQRCIHRDIKPQNLLFDFEGNLKVTDFGLSSRSNDTQPRRTVAGTAIYMAPEMAEEVYRHITRADPGSLEYGKEVDVWSVGIVLYVMLTRQNPYIHNLSRNTQDKTKKQHELFHAVASAAWEWPVGWQGDNELRRVVDWILHKDKSRRATLEQVRLHPLWKRRPLSCPLSLMKSLMLVETFTPERVHAGRSLSRMSANTPVQKRSVDECIRSGITRVEQAEFSARTAALQNYYELTNTLFKLHQMSVGESQIREDIRFTESSQRKKIVTQAGQPRQGSISLITTNAKNGPTLVRASVDQYAIAYPGRETSTRWNLRPIVSLPRDFSSSIEEFRCLNRHIMTKLTAMPAGYNGFDCNVCNSKLLKINAECCTFRCFRCDYDLCLKCARGGRECAVDFTCVTCAKRFPTEAKLKSHSLRCRGPSCSPGRDPRNTAGWDEGHQRPSLLEVQLPEPDKRRQSTRRSVGLLSDIDLDEQPRRFSTSGGRYEHNTPETRRSAAPRLSSYELPPPPPKREREPARVQLRESTELHERLSKQQRLEAVELASLPQKQIGQQGTIVIACENAARPTEKFNQPPLVRRQTEQKIAAPGAFLALPQQHHNRQLFLDDFLGGSWVRFFTFPNEEQIVLFYCLQPGRFGALFPNAGGVGTAVLDIHSRMVLFVPCMTSESTNRSNPHPHVQTFYDEEVRILSLAEAQRTIHDVLNSIMATVSEINRMKAEGLSVAASHAAFVHGRDQTSVSRDTKFAYIRKVFPDPAGTFTLFRLSNLRSQVICNSPLDIRWQSDRRHNVGQKYYVHADGTAEPFVVDHTGILSQVESVLSNNFRR